MPYSNTQATGEGVQAPTVPTVPLSNFEWMEKWMEFHLRVLHNFMCTALT